VEAFSLPVVEVPPSDITKREEWRAGSVLSDVSAAGILGRGVDGCREAPMLLAARGQVPAR
jgi:3-dehydroquinate dehydratase